MSRLSQIRKSQKDLTAKLGAKLDGYGKRPTFKKDDDEEGFWSPTQGKDGNGWAIIRFLPSGDLNEDPFVHYERYAFEAPKGWYIERSRKSIGEDDPAAEFLSDLWKTDKEQAKKYTRSKVNIANVLVIEDPANPDNNGKVFRFKFGKQIVDKINEAFHPKVPTKKPVDAFSIDDGANFNLVIVTKDKYKNYEQSYFDPPSLLAGGDEKKMEAILDQCIPLAEFVAPDKYKSYDELKKRFDKVMGLSGSSGPVTKAPSSEPKKERAAEAPELPSGTAQNIDELLDSVGDVGEGDMPF